MAAARGLAVAVGLAIVAAALVVADPTALCMLPALLLAVPLLLRRYPGERLLAGASRVGHSRRLVPRSRSLAPMSAVEKMPRGGLLIARSLAVRPPPLFALPAS